VKFWACPESAAGPRSIWAFAPEMSAPIVSAAAASQTTVLRIIVLLEIPLKAIVAAPKATGAAELSLGRRRGPGNSTDMSSDHMLTDRPAEALSFRQTD